MSLDHVLLGLLREPSSGYDLKTHFERGAKFFWSAEFGQIYSTLKRMVKNGWLTCKEVPSEKGPARKVYKRTKTGTKELHQWLNGSPVYGAERYAYVAQIIFLGEVGDPARTIEFVEELQAHLQVGLEVVTGSQASHEEQLAANPGDLTLLHGLLATQLGVATLKAKVAWCRATVRRLRAEFATEVDS